MNTRRAACAAALALLLAGLAVGAARAQPVGERIAADLREEVHHVSVTVRDLDGREGSGRIPVTVFRPAGEGPFPLAIVSHGRSGGEARAATGRQRFELLARYLVTKGFAVLVPTRLGYGATFSRNFDPEASGPCRAKVYAPMATAASEQVLATLAYARTLPWVDARRWVAVGQSVGGMATLAVASRAPEGLVAAINFSGGAGGDPMARTADPCGPEEIARLWRTQAATSGALPTLWLYWSHDRYWGERIPRRWAEAWREGGGRVQLHQLGPWSGPAADGHAGLASDMDRWVPIVEAFLDEAGFHRSGMAPRPAATDFARVDEVEKVPVTPARREGLYRPFLAAPSPRAFAISESGVAGWASGDWARGRALGNCQWRDGRPCRLYAVDDEVVWVRPDGTPQ